MTLLTIPQELVDENRVGRVVFPKGWLRAYPSLMDDMSDALYVLRSQVAGDQDEITVVALCDKFDPVPTALVPKYEFDYDQWRKSGDVIFRRVPGFETPERVNGGN